ncbi:hypothetical protein FQR65_LT01770 [Abscondita terminalis]|nr:hypothetical protein FQR65_LT01770 [Abscondita terminalis]
MHCRFLRSQKGYNPPENVRNKVNHILEGIIGTKDDNFRLDDLNKRFEIFQACSNEFQHSIPNSLLHVVQTVGDLIDYYATPVATITPYENLQNLELPKNLHVQHEYHRFHPETDTMFNGITAFPRSSTIVSGLKYKGKYKGHEQRETWPFTT